MECIKNNVSVKKNISEETIKKKLPDEYLIGFKKAIKSLLAKGLLVKYRPHNYGLSKDGRILSRRIQDKHQKKFYSNLRMLVLVD